ncbi:MAG: heme-binding protein [Bacteroidales bacterium]|nr:heme-binding protein [Bacteroidales bacterium]
MKTFLIISIAAAMVVIATQVKTARSAGRTEQYPYKVIKTYRDFEIRQYERAIFARTKVAASTYRSGSSEAFRTLASYIFGGNERNESIAMTSPVAMRQDQGLEMEFMMPSKYSMESLPTPNRQNIEFYEKPEVVMAAISFKGWASDAKIAEMTETLKLLLEKESITHTGNFIYLGYNPPYQVINRRNEIVVEIIK